MDSVLLVGKKEPIDIYELIGFTDDIDDDTKTMVKYYAEALHAYREREWGTAITWFKKAKSLFPEDKAILTMLQRCREFKSSPPTGKWNSAFKLTSK